MKRCILLCCLFMVMISVVSCARKSASDNTSNPSSDKEVKTNVIVSSDEVWENKDITVTGILTIDSGSHLTLNNVALHLSPQSEDSTIITVNSGFLSVNASSIDSDSGKQWNLEAYGTSTLSFTNSTATNHSGIRANDSTIITISNSSVEEVQCHDNATININNGSSVYLVLFFDDTGSVDLPAGTLITGDNITRSFTFKSTSSPASSICGKINISKSSISGFQLDISQSTDLTIHDGTDIVLALHLADVGTIDVSQNITSMTSGIIDFSSGGGPKFTFSNATITYINTYVSGVSNVTFSGTVKVVEANVMDSASLAFGSGTSLVADLVQAYDSSTMTLNGVTLISDSTTPSITASGTSVITLNNVNALSGTNVYSEDDGKVYINHGSGWLSSMFESAKPGNIVYIP